MRLDAGCSRKRIPQPQSRLFSLSNRSLWSRLRKRLIRISNLHFTWIDPRLTHRIRRSIPRPLLRFPLFSNLAKSRNHRSSSYGFPRCRSHCHKLLALRTWRNEASMDEIKEGHEEIEEHLVQARIARWRRSNFVEWS